MFNKKFLRLIAISTLSLSLCACSFGGKKENNKVAPVAQEVDQTFFSTVQVAKGDVDVIVSTGVSYKTASVEPYSFGFDNVKIAKAYVAVGDFVKKGDLLLECDSKEIVSNLERHEKEKADCLASIEYYTKLFEIESSKKALYATYGKEFNTNDYISYSKSVDDYNDKLNVLNYKIEEDKKSLEKCQIYAEKDGTIGFVASTNEYTTLSKKETAITIKDENAYFYANVNDENVRLFKVGEIYDLNIKLGKKKNEEENNENMSAKVKCTSIDILDDKENTYILLFEPAEDVTFLNELKGFSCKINITTESAKNVLYIPKNTIIKTADGYCVYVQSKNGLRDVKNIEIGLMGSDFVEVKSGLELGDEIISKLQE